MTRNPFIKTTAALVCYGLFLGGGAVTAAQGQQGQQGQQATLSVPSGQAISFLQFISEDDGKMVRFRFHAPGIGAGFGYGEVFDDFQVLCDEQVMPVLTLNNLYPSQIVLSMSAADIPFGKDDPSVLQFFEVFRPQNDICIWEEF